MPLIVAIIVGRIVWTVSKRCLTDYEWDLENGIFVAGLYSFIFGLLSSLVIAVLFYPSIKVGHTKIGEYDLIPISADNKFAIIDEASFNFNFIYDNNGSTTHVYTNKSNDIHIHEIQEDEVCHVSISTEFKYNTLYTHLLLFPYAFAWDISPDKKMIYDVYINPTNILITKEEASN